MYLSHGNSRKKWFVVIGAVVLIMASVFIYATGAKDDEEKVMTLQPIQAVAAQTEPDSKREDESKLEPKDIVVDVKGEVVSPNVYVLKEGARVNDAVIAAGGMTPDADRDIINLAMLLTDGMAIVIPKIGEESRATIDLTGGSAVSGKAENGKININNADASQLDTLPGIGPSKAEAIIQYRNDNGPFGAIEDLKNVSGIGDKTFEQLKEFITVH